jgi:hypothetical protein
MPVERFSIDEHGWVEERGAEESVPAQGDTSRGKSVGAAALSLSIEVDHRAPDDGDSRLGADPGQLALEPLGGRDVVVVEPRDVAPGRNVEAAVQ